MDKLLSWFNTPARKTDVILMTAIILLAAFVTTFLMMFYLWYFEILKINTTGIINATKDNSTYGNMLLFVYKYIIITIVTPIIEELVFRLVPIGIMFVLVFKYGVNKNSIFLVAVLSGILFGVLHVYNGIPLSHALIIQGVFGVGLGLLFIKVVGINNNVVENIHFSRLMDGYIAVIIPHAIWNGAIVPTLVFLLFLISMIYT